MPKKPPKDGLVFPRALRHARKAAGFHTQEAFAEECSVHPETVGRYERGDQAPSEYTVTHMIEKLREADPRADLATLAQAAEQDRRTFWSMEPISAPADSADLPPDPPRNPNRPGLTTDPHPDTTDDSEQQGDDFPSPKLAQLAFGLMEAREAFLREGEVKPFSLPPDGSCTKEQWSHASIAVQDAFASLWTDREHVRYGKMTLSALHAKWSQKQPHCSPLLAIIIPREDIDLSPEVMKVVDGMMVELDGLRWLKNVR